MLNLYRSNMWYLKTVYMQLRVFTFSLSVFLYLCLRREVLTRNCTLEYKYHIRRKWCLISLFRSHRMTWSIKVIFVWIIKSLSMTPWWLMSTLINLKTLTITILLKFTVKSPLFSVLVTVLVGLAIALPITMVSMGKFIYKSTKSNICK